VIAIKVLASAVPRIVLDVRAERTIVGLDETVVQAGGAAEPAETNICPAEPVELLEPTPKAKDVLSVKPVVPLDCSAKTPEVSAVVLTPEEPDTTPLSEFMVEANLLLLVLAIFKMPAGHCL
jgi:hypothetical protein